MKKFVWVLVAALAFGACSDDDSKDETPRPEVPGDGDGDGGGEEEPTIYELAIETGFAACVTWELCIEDIEDGCRLMVEELEEAMTSHVEESEADRVCAEAFVALNTCIEGLSCEEFEEYNTLDEAYPCETEYLALETSCSAVPWGGFDE